MENQNEAIAAIILYKFPNHFDIKEHSVEIVVAQIGDDYFNGKSHIFVSTQNHTAIKLAEKLCQDNFFTAEIPPLSSAFNMSWFVCHKHPEEITSLLAKNKIIIKKNKSV